MQAKQAITNIKLIYSNMRKDTLAYQLSDGQTQQDIYQAIIKHFQYVSQAHNTIDIQAHQYKPSLARQKLFNAIILELTK